MWNRALSAAEVALLVIPDLPSFPNAITPTGVTGVTSYTWTCAAGYAGANMTYRANTTDNTWSLIGGPVMSCQLCPVGSYARAGSATCSVCPAGRYGNTAGATSELCAGSCDPGYYCPANSTMPRITASASCSW